MMHELAAEVQNNIPVQSTDNDPTQSHVGILPTNAYRHGKSVIIPSDFRLQSTRLFGRKPGIDGDEEQSKRLNTNEKQSKYVDCLYDELQEYMDGKGIATAIYSAINSTKWSFHRTLDDHLTGSCNTVTGTINFSLIPSENWKDTSLLYKEVGKLLLPNGHSFDTSQHYIYELDECSNSINLWFCKMGNTSISAADEISELKSMVRDYPFIKLKFRQTEEGWEATDYHPCSADHYNAKYRFAFAGTTIKEIVVEFTVKGPKKDYHSNTVISPAKQLSL